MVAYVVFFWRGCWDLLTFRTFLLFWCFIPFFCFFFWLTCFPHSWISSFTSVESGFRHVWSPFFSVAMISIFSQEELGANCLRSFKDFKWIALSLVVMQEQRPFLIIGAPWTSIRVRKMIPKRKGEPPLFIVIEWNYFNSLLYWISILRNSLENMLGEIIFI